MISPKRFAAILLVGLLAGASMPVRAAETAGAQLQTEQVQLQFTKHARARMQERNVSEKQARETIAKGEKFKYYYAGKWKDGYYDPRTLLFVSTDGPVVITVIGSASRRYINKLKAVKP